MSSTNRDTSSHSLTAAGRIYGNYVHLSSETRLEISQANLRIEIVNQLYFASAQLTMFNIGSSDFTSGAEVNSNEFSLNSNTVDQPCVQKLSTHKS